MPGCATGAAVRSSSLVMNNGYGSSVLEAGLAGLAFDPFHPLVITPVAG